MRELVRVTMDRDSLNFIVEYGSRQKAGLSAEESDEYKKLNDELLGYSDFAAAEERLEDDRQGLMEKKRRFEELRDKAEIAHVEWVPEDPKNIESLFILLRPDNLPTYIENLPGFMLDKLISPNLNIQMATITFGPDFPPPPGNMGALEVGTPLKQTVLQVLATARSDWAKLVEVFDLPDGSVKVKPRKFLEEAWTPINNMFRERFGDVWKSKGKGDKEAHWLIPAR